MNNQIVDFEETDVSKIRDDFPQKRDCFSKIKQYFLKPNISRVCIIYGLRRTGKTILLKQTLLSLSEEERKKSVFITCNYKTDFYNVLSFLKQKLDSGYKNFFIDEITYAKNFQNLAEVLSDNFVANYNAKILLTGTDSLGLSLPSHSNLYDRAEFVHTTYVSFPEFARITGNHSIDYYMKHGNTLSDFCPFDNYSDTQEYVETSIVSNLICSLQKSESVRSYPPALTELYDNNDLDNAIQRIINQYPQAITMKALRKQFDLSPLDNAVNALANTREDKDFTIKSTVLSNVITNNVKKLLNISDFKTNITEQHLNDIKSFLKEMDVITSIPVISSFEQNIQNVDMEFITHPGMYHANLAYTIDVLNNNNNWMPNATNEQKQSLLKSVYDCSAGKIQENFIIADVYKMLCEDNILNKQKWYVSKLSKRINNIDEEADLIIFDKLNKEVYLFEIKHSSQIHESQSKHLESENFIEYVKLNFGTIKGCAVLYNGNNDVSMKIPRFNAAAFLEHIYNNCSNSDYSINDTIQYLTTRPSQKTDKEQNLHSKSISDDDISVS